jgi:pimeloyl-ACP methyl ester carboxylesterase
MTTTTPLPHVVLLPGMDGTDALFGPLCAALAGFATAQPVVLPHGGDQSYEQLLPHVLAAVAAAGPCLVLGWSFSGPLALLAAERRPDLVRGVILVATFVTPPMDWLPWVRPILRGPLWALVRVVRRLPLWLLRPSDDPLRVAKARIWREVPARVLAARARSLAVVDVRQTLRNCRTPLLYLQSTADRVVRRHHLARIHALRADVRVQTLPGGHFALFTAAGNAATAIHDFATSSHP